jgi:phenylalanyl-tRNA synthetase beta chain
VQIDAPDLCGRFAGRVIRGVNPKAKTPDWIIQRLCHAGQRSITPLVDLSNYVMLEMGQPTHVFDLDQLQGDLQVRWAKPGEQIALLNEQTLNPIVQGEISNQLAQGVGVVADNTGPVSLAGIMGGNATAVSDNTVNIYVEAAFWWPAAIQGRARRFNFTTDAGHRFERGVDPAATVTQLEYLSSLILDVCGGQAGPIQDQITQLPERKPVRLRLQRAIDVIGIPLTTATVSDVFTRLGFAFTVNNDADAAKTTFIVTPPSYRFDIEIEEDLIEEVARLYGFENIPDHPPTATLKMSAPPEARRGVHRLRHALAQAGYQEAVNFGFTDRESEVRLSMHQGDESQVIQVRNPIANQYAVMRSTLWGGLLGNLRANLNRGNNRIRLFEIGRVFMRNPSQVEAPGMVAGYDQPRRVGGLAYGLALPEQWASKSRVVDFFDVKGDLESAFAPLQFVTMAATHPALHPGRSAQIAFKVGNKTIPVGWIGELHPALQQAYELPQAPVLFECDWDALAEMGLPAPVEISKFPAVQRDLAVVVKQSVAAQTLLDAMAAAGQTLVRHIEVFDEFRPVAGSGSMAADEKSLAFRITLQNPAETLQDAQIDAAIAALLSALEKCCNARLR